MVSGASSLGLVRDELFATIEEAESCLEQFIVERNNGSLLQRAVDNLQQVRGTLSLIELAGGELLAQAVLDRATDIPAGAGNERDEQLAALSNALHVLRRYLEGLDAYRPEMPELLLPAINALRQSGGQPLLPESYFFSVRLDQPRPLRELTVVASDEETRRLRQMYQVGLLGFIREQNIPASLRLMGRAMSRLDGITAGQPRGRLFWLCAAALQAQGDAQMLPRKSRKQLFARIDRELRQLAGNAQYEPPRSLLKELLYLVALSESQGELVAEVREVFGILPLPFTDHLLEEEYQRLSGPGQAVMCSLSSAIREELVSIKDLLDLIERDSLPVEGLANLHAVLGKLSKTLAMVGLGTAGNSLAAQLPTVASWCEGAKALPDELLRLAYAVLHVEAMIALLERGERRIARPPEPQSITFAEHQLFEAQVVVLDEARAGLALAKRAISAYLEASGDRMHLANVPFSLQAVRGGLWFLGQERAAALVGGCADYIQTQMLDTEQVPSEQRLEVLADALSSLEYYLEADAVLSQPGVLDLASDSVRALGMPVAA